MACGRAQRVLDESIDPAEADRLRADVEAVLDELAELEEQAVELSDLDADDLPKVQLPVAEPTGADDELTVCDSSWTFAQQTERLLAQKAYDLDEDDAA